MKPCFVSCLLALSISVSISSFKKYFSLYCWYKNSQVEVQSVQSNFPISVHSYPEYFGLTSGLWEVVDTCSPLGFGRERWTQDAEVYKQKGFNVKGVFCKTQTKQTLNGGQVESQGRYRNALGTRGIRARKLTGQREPEDTSKTQGWNQYWNE